MKYNTLDIDINPRIHLNGKELLNNILTKISFCPNSLSIEIKDSNSKGYHIFMYCSINCDLCRFVFDDDKRYMLDFDRIEVRKNVMFDVKGVFP